MLTCKEFDDFMIDYLEHELPLKDRFGCWLHLKMCRHCSRFVREYQQTITLGKQAFDEPDDPVPESVPEDLINAAVAYRRKQKSS